MQRWREGALRALASEVGVEACAPQASAALLVKAGLARYSGGCLAVRRSLQ